MKIQNDINDIWNESLIGKLWLISSAVYGLLVLAYFLELLGF